MAHLLADGTVNPYFNLHIPNAYGVYNVVAALAHHTESNTLYIGGRFQSINGIPRENLAAIDLGTGQVTEWNPGATAPLGTQFPVHALLINTSSNTLYVGGGFTAVAGQPIRYLSAISLTADNHIRWAPQFETSSGGIDGSGGVKTLAYDSNQQVLLVGGTFQRINGLTRQNLAAFHLSNHQLASWNPSVQYHYPGGAVHSMAVHPERGTVLIGGTFTYVGTSQRSHLAEISLSTGHATPWAATVSSRSTPAVFAVAYDETGDRIYFGGRFNAVTGEVRSRLAALDAHSGAVLPWNPGVGGEVFTIVPLGGAISIGGRFATARGLTRHNLAAFEKASGQPTPWDPGVTVSAGAGGIAAVRTLLLDDASQTLIVGGSFSQAGGALRRNLAAFDVASGAVTPWNPQVRGEPYEFSEVSALELFYPTSTLFVGGTFTRAGDELRRHLAAYDMQSGELRDWAPLVGGDPVSGGVRVFSLHGSIGTLYVGGIFHAIDDHQRNHVAAFDAFSAELTPFNPGTNGPVLSMAFSDAQETLYLGGSFTSIGGLPRNTIGAVDRSGAVTTWDPNPDYNGYGYVRSMALDSLTGMLYVGGCFDSMGGKPRRQIAALQPMLNELHPWDIELGMAPLTLAITYRW